MREEDLYREWLKYLKKHYSIIPDLIFNNINEVDELVILRDEHKDINSRLYLLYPPQDIIDLKEYYSKNHKVITFEEFKYAMNFDYDYIKNHINITFAEFKKQKYGN